MGPPGSLIEIGEPGWLSCPDWETKVRARQSLIPPAALTVNPAEARRAIGIFNKLRLPDVPGTPALLEAAGAWFREIVGAFLGSVDRDTGARLIRELFLLAAKKSSKTSYGAAMMLTALLLNKRPRAEFLLIAPTQAISDLAFSQASGMVAADPDGFLQKRMHVQDHVKCITDRRTRAQLKVKTFDSSILTGIKPAGVLLDELHEISKNSKSARIVGQIRGGLLPIPEAFLAFITTQADEPPAGAFKAELMTARAIRDGKASGAMLPVLYEFPLSIAKDQHAWQNPVNWPMVTPNVGKSITIERLIEDFSTAKLKGDEEIRRWASQHLNIEIGIGLHSDRWPGVEFWQRRADRSLTLDTLLDRSEVVIVGIDGGGLDDLFGLAVLGREPEEILVPVKIGDTPVMLKTKRWLLWSHAWCHEGVLDRRKSIAAKLLEFKAAGELTIVDDELADISSIVEIVQLVKDRRLLGGVAVDPAGLGEFVDAMDAIDVKQENKLLHGVGQGYRMMNAINTGARRLVNGTLLHGGSGLMTWCVGNLKIEATATAIRATKMNAGDAKIDPAMAMFDAIDLMTMNPAAAPEYQMLFV